MRLPRRSPETPPGTRRSAPAPEQPAPRPRRRRGSMRQGQRLPLARYGLALGRGDRAEGRPQSRHSPDCPQITGKAKFAQVRTILSNTLRSRVRRFESCWGRSETICENLSWPGRIASRQLPWFRHSPQARAAVRRSAPIWPPRGCGPLSLAAGDASRQDLHDSVSCGCPMILAASARARPGGMNAWA